MPWFESSKDKEFRELVEGKMNICLSKPDKYAEAFPLLDSLVRKPNQKAIEMIVDHIKQVIKEDEFPPQQKLQAIYLLRDLMKTQNKALGKYVVTKILKRLSIFAEHRKNQKSQNRGADIFKTKKKSDEKFGIQFLKTLLLCLSDWGKNWPKSADGPFHDFQEVYNVLLMQKEIAFPPDEKKTNKSPLAKKQSATPPKLSSSKLDNKISQQSIQEKKTLSPPVLAYLNEMDELLMLVCSTLEQNSVYSQIWPVIKAFIDQFKLIDEKGNMLVAQMMSKGQNNEQALNIIQSNSQFIQSITKDSIAVDKNNENYKVFNSKYIKQCKRLQLSLSVLTKKQSLGEKKQQNETSLNSKMQQSKIEKPKAEYSKNRYGSSNQLRNQLQNNLAQITKQDFNSGTFNNKQFDNSDKFNSKNRNSISQFNNVNTRESPQNKKSPSQKEKLQDSKAESNAFGDSIQKKEKKESDKKINLVKVEQNKYEDSKEQIQIKNKKQAIPKGPQMQKKQVKKNQADPWNQNNEFQNENQKQNKNNMSASFGDFEITGKRNSQDSNSEFFRQIQQKEKNPTGTNTRSRKPPTNPKKADGNTNYFDNSMKSKQFSELSGFEKSKEKSKTDSKQIAEGSLNAQKKIGSQQNYSLQLKKQQKQVQKPKGFDTFSSPNQLKKAFEEFKNSDKASHRSSVSNPFQEKPEAVSMKDIKQIDNPFASKFDERSFRKTQNSIDNPFENKQNPFDTNFANDNPFQSKIPRNSFQRKPNDQDDNKSRSSNPFSQKNDFSKSSIKSKPPHMPRKKSQISNPFDTKSQKEGKNENPFERTIEKQMNTSQISNPFERSDKKNPSEKAMSQRGSFVQVSNNILEIPHTKQSKLVFEDPFEETGHRNSTKNVEENRHSLEIKSKRSDQQKKEKMFGFEDFPNFDGNKSESKSVKSKKSEGFNFSQFGDVNPDKKDKNKSNQDNFFFDQSQQRNSQRQRQRQKQKQKQRQKQKQKGENTFDFFNMSNRENKNMEKDFFNTSKMSEGGERVKEQEKQKKKIKTEQINFEDFPDFSNAKNQDKTKEKRQSKQKIEEKQVPKESKQKKQVGFGFDQFPNFSLSQSRTQNKSLSFQNQEKKNKQANQQKEENSFNFSKKEIAIDEFSKMPYNKGQPMREKQIKSKDNSIRKSQQGSSDEWNKFANIVENKSENDKSEKDLFFENRQRQQRKPGFSRQFQEIEDISHNSKYQKRIYEPVKGRDYQKVIEQIPKIMIQQAPHFGQSERSISIQFEETSAFQKKEISWQENATAFESTTRFKISEEMVNQRRQVFNEFQQENRRRKQKLSQAHDHLVQIRKVYTEEIKKISEAGQQREQFENIYKRLSQSNKLKQLEIEELIKKIKKAQQIKRKILEKQRLLYERLKNEKNSRQINRQGDRQTYTNKFEKFNKNLRKVKESSYLYRSQSNFSYYN